jgi:cysteine-rich repeat protein
VYDFAMLRGALLTVLLVGCVDSSSIFCANGDICPTGTRCDPTHQQCVASDAFDACSGIADGTRCTTKLREGICDQSVCIPGCGDGVQDTTDTVAVAEECDDGNPNDHDGCAAVCKVEKAAWVPWKNPWTARSGHVAAYDISRKRLVVFGGNDETGPTDDLWERDPDGDWTQIDIPRPSARTQPAMAYDANRNVIVLFGGAEKQGGVLDDTWEYDGAWKQVMPATKPSGRAGAGMTYDPEDKLLLLYGGFDKNPTTLGYQSDTWTYNGTTWTKLNTGGTSQPAPRNQHGFTWDVARKRAVMFGGIRVAAGGNNTASNSETWELVNVAGTGWTWTCIAGQGGAVDTCPSVSQRPFPRYGAAMVYTQTRGEVVLFGGLAFYGGATTNTSDTWFYDGAWTSQSQVMSPTARNDAAIADIEAPGGSWLPLIVGGAIDGGAIDDVWELPAALNPSSWFPRLTPGKSPARHSASLVYDPIRQRAQRIAGYQAPSVRVDVYEFTGTAWKKFGNIPDARYLHSSTYDSTNNRVIVFGGLFFSGVPQSQTYVSKAGAPFELATSSGPSARWGAAFAHDEKAGTTVLFGGRQNQSFGDTWEITSSGYTENTSAGGPGPQVEAVMAYDRARERLVMFGTDDTTWIYENRAWKQLPTLASPGARHGARLTFNPNRELITLFGGTDNSSGTSSTLNDVWELRYDGDTPTWVEVQTSTAPPARTVPGFAPFEPLGVLMLHGGASTSGDSLDDTWFFQYRYEQ